MTIYIEALYPDKTPILGNGDGQGPIVAKNYKRTRFYRHLKGHSSCAFPRFSQPKYYQVTTESGLVLEQWDNPYYKEPST